MQDIARCYQQFLGSLINQNLVAGATAIEMGLASGISAEKLLLQVVNKAMDDIGRRQANREITLSEIYVIARIADTAISRLTALLPRQPVAVGTVVIGTVAGDYHGLGRKIVASFLRAGGFVVHDLGVSVPSDLFVESAVGVGASVICASAFLLHTTEKVANIRENLRERGLENRIKLVVGGAAFNFDLELHRALGADAMAINASDAVPVLQRVMAEVVHG